MTTDPVEDIYGYLQPFMNFVYRKEFEALNAVLADHPISRMTNTQIVATLRFLAVVQSEIVEWNDMLTQAWVELAKRGKNPNLLLKGLEDNPLRPFKPMEN